MKTLALLSVALVACASNEAAPAPTTITSAEVTVDVDPASDRISTERCERQIACGSARDRRACLVAQNEKTHALLGRSCVSIDATRLGACLDDLRGQRCDQLEEIPVSCEGVRLCR